MLLYLLTGCGVSKTPEATPEQTGKAAKVASAEEPATQSKPGTLHLSKEESEQSGLMVKLIEPEKISDQLILTANISANQDRIARVVSPVEGRLIKVMANLGDQVKAGQSLALIDSVQLAEARAEYSSSQSELRLSEANFQRSDRLYREEVIPQKQWLEAKSAYDRAQASARGSAERMRMLGGLSGSGSSSFVVTAPFSGTVIEKDAVLGEQAKSDSNLFTVADLNTVWIEADVSEKDLGKLAIGSPATVTVTSFPNESFKGKVGYISSQFDKQTRTVKARVELPNPDKKLRIDMFARVAIDLSGTREALVLPQEAVLLVQGQSIVYIQTENGFEARPVEVGEQLNKGVVIASGLKSGEQVVISGAYALKSRQLKSQIGDAD
jgi:cobalt-zinc-cadmium efflux system membrane fusion protein